MNYFVSEVFVKVSGWCSNTVYSNKPKKKCNLCHSCDATSGLSASIFPEFAAWIIAVAVVTKGSDYIRKPYSNILWNMFCQKRDSKRFFILINMIWVATTFERDKDFQQYSNEAKDACNLSRSTIFVRTAIPLICAIFMVIRTSKYVSM